MKYILTGTDEVGLNEIAGIEADSKKEFVEKFSELYNFRVYFGLSKIKFKRIKKFFKDNDNFKVFVFEEGTMDEINLENWVF